MAQLRQSPSGPAIVGNAPGDLLIWNGTEWVPGAPAPGASSAFDFVVETLADLPAPVAGVIELTDGSWAFKAPIDVGANIVRVPTGTTVLLKGMGGFQEKTLSGDDASVLDVQGSAYLETLSVEATAGVALAMSVNASVTSTMCSLTGGLEAMTMEAGLWRDSQSRLSGGTEGLRITGGSCNLVRTRISGGTENALAASGADVAAVWLNGCRLSAASTDTVRWDCSAGDFQAADTELVCGSGGSACFLHLLGLAVQFVGGRWEGDSFAPGVGLLIDGNLTRLLQVVGVEAFSLASMIERSSGTVRQATVQGCASFSDVAVGITWAAASAPTNGLAIVGNTFDTATPFSGFDHTDARVNSKANVDSAGLMLETAIVV
jgi:hypothetical protein